MYPVFENGSCWVKVDFHLHTRADKEFRYAGGSDRYIRDYVSALKAAEVGVGVITNHNKFDPGEFKALRKAARHEGMELLPGVELSVNDGQAGVHTLVVFADEWFINPQQTNHIESFLTATFAGVDNFENENARSTENITQTIQRLDRYERDYFIVFAHVEAPNGLWGGLSPGRIGELFDNELIRRRVTGFQKVMTHDLRVKIKGVLGERYPAEVQGCDAKTLDHIGARKVASYLKLGDYSFEAVRFALQDFPHRVSGEKPALNHSHIRQIAFEGAGSLGGTVVKLSPELNTLIGIRGSGKSSILEGIRYALDIPFGEKASDRDYKENLVSNLLKSGGKITVDAVCRHGRAYQITRIFGQEPQVIFDGQARHGVALRETVLHKPVYFGQKDLSNTGAGFEHDLIEKLVGERLATMRNKIRQQEEVVLDRLREYRRLKTSGETLTEWQAKEKDAQFRLRFYAQHGMEEKLARQTTFGRDERYLSSTTERATRALDSLQDGIRETLDELKQEQKHESAHNQADIDDYSAGYDRFMAHLGSLNTIVDGARRLLTYLIERHGEVASRDDILETVWTMHGLRSSNNSLNKYIADLRKIFVNLELGTEVIITVPKVGFMMSRDVDIEIKQTDDDVFPLQSPEEALPVISQKRYIPPLRILVLTAVIITGGVVSLFSDSVLKLELFGRNEIPESPVFYLGDVDGCKIMTLQPGSEKMTPVKLTLAREVMKHANIFCTPDTEIYFQPSDPAVYGDKGRVFLSRCTFNKFAKGKFAACKNYYGVNYRNE